MNYYEIVKKLIGEIEPIGETQIDKRHLANLGDTIILIDRLVNDVSDVARYSNRPEYSMSLAGKRAAEYLFSLKESLEDESK